MKITKATFKSFVKKHQDELLISCRSSFDGMTDGLAFNRDKTFKSVESSANPINAHDLGVNGVWLVGGGRDYFNVYEKNGIRGIECCNCCGSFIVGVAV